MDRPASLCWEGVALGWRETVPRPRSRGGEVLQKEHNGALHGLQREHHSGGLQGSHVSSPSEIHQPASLRLDSGLNSLEYWDYSVELECITGQQGTQRREECHALKEETRLSLWLLLGGSYITDRCSKSPLVTATMSHQGEL